MMMKGCGRKQVCGADPSNDNNSISNKNEILMMKWKGFGSDNDLREAAGWNLPAGTEEHHSVPAKTQTEHLLSISL